MRWKSAARTSGISGKPTRSKTSLWQISSLIGYGVAVSTVSPWLGVKADGIVGPKTIAALNAQNPKIFFEKVWMRRQRYLNDICRTRPANYKFLTGWVNRLNGIKYGSLVLNTRPKKTITF